MPGAAPEFPGKGRKVVALAFSGQHTHKVRAALQGAIDWGKSRNWHMIKLDEWLWEVPEGIEPDGLITYLGPTKEDQQLGKALRKRIPASVAIGTFTPHDTVPHVHLDDQALGEQAIRHFRERGFRNFAYAIFKEESGNAAITAFKRRVEEHGCTCGSITGLSIADRDTERVYTMFKERIHAMEFPLAVFCSTDTLASRVCLWCLRSGLAVPEEVAILGIGNDIATCESCPVPVSSIDCQPTLLGTQAAHILENIMSGASVSPGPAYTPPAGVVTRLSTDITALPNPTGARALRYIWDHYKEDIGAPEVSAACGVHTRTLDRCLKKSLGHTVAGEIRRRRLSAACDMLRSGNVKIAEVAALVGFKTPQHFNSRFKQTFGMTPRQYRATGDASSRIRA